MTTATYASRLTREVKANTDLLRAIADKVGVVDDEPAPARRRTRRTR